MEVPEPRAWPGTLLPRMKRSSAMRRSRPPVQEPIFPHHSESFVWRQDDYPLSWSVWNSHPECEIHLITSSQGTCYVGDYIGPFSAGDLYMVGRNLPHNWVTPLGPSETVTGRDVLVQFDQDRLVGSAETLPELHRLARLFQLAERGLRFEGATREEGRTLLEAIGSAPGLRRLSLFLELLGLLATTKDYYILSSAEFSPNPDAKANAILRDVLKRLADTPEDDIRLSRMAKVAGMTETSFSRFFKKNTGNTFTRHLSELRIGMACQLLAHPAKPVTEVCHEVGYENLSNFNRTFRALRGMSPNAYRKLSRA